MERIKLYRGLKNGDLKFINQETVAQHAEIWRQILVHRQKSTRYPEHLNEAIIRLHKETRLYRQAFSDYKETAERYATGGGILVELKVPINDILRCFELEIQNYDKRRQCFEIVYTIAFSQLVSHMESWHYQITPM